MSKRLTAARRFTAWTGLDALDVGCGNGAYTESIARDAASTVGVDFERRWLKAFRGRAGVDGGSIAVVQAAAEHLPLPSARFDVTFCIETLEHVRDERQALDEIHRVLRPGGRLILTVPNKWYLFETHGLAAGPITGNRIPFVSWLPRQIHSRIAAARIYRKADVRRLLQGAGFVDVRMDYVMPPLDKVGARRARALLRRALRVMEHSSLRTFGVSIVAVACKPT